MDKSDLQAAFAARFKTRDADILDMVEAGLAALPSIAEMEAELDELERTLEAGVS